MKKAIAMKCTQEDWDSIKDLIPKKINAIIWGGFEDNNYLTNNWGEELQIGNHSKWHSCYDRCEIHEKFNAKIFLEACGIEVEQKFEITKKQILKLHKNEGSRYVKEWFPEAFKKELEIGKYYKNITHKGSWFFYDGKVGEEKTSYTSYGCDSGGNWHAEDVFGNWNTSNEYEEMTQQEVETALINEAKKRGFVKGIVIKREWCVTKEIVIKGNSFIYNHEENWMTNSGREVYSKGKWATIIETISKEEAEKLLNKKIV